MPCPGRSAPLPSSACCCSAHFICKTVSLPSPPLPPAARNPGHLSPLRHCCACVCHGGASAGTVREHQPEELRLGPSARVGDRGDAGPLRVQLQLLHGALLGLSLPRTHCLPPLRRPRRARTFPRQTRTRTNTHMHGHTHMLIALKELAPPCQPQLRHRRAWSRVAVAAPALLRSSYHVRKDSCELCDYS